MVVQILKITCAHEFVGDGDGRFVAASTAERPQNGALTHSVEDALVATR